MAQKRGGHVSSQIYLLVLKPWGTDWDLGLLGRGHGMEYPSFPNPGKTLVWFKLNEHPERMRRLLVTAKADIVSSSSATVVGQIKPLPGEEVIIPLCASIKDKIGVTFLFHCCICSSNVNSHQNSLFALWVLHAWALWCMLLKSDKGENYAHWSQMVYSDEWYCGRLANFANLYNLLWCNLW